MSRAPRTSLFSPSSSSSSSSSSASSRLAHARGRAHMQTTHTHTVTHSFTRSLFLSFAPPLSLLPAILSICLSFSLSLSLRISPPFVYRTVTTTPLCNTHTLAFTARDSARETGVSREAAPYIRASSRASESYCRVKSRLDEFSCRRERSHAHTYDRDRVAFGRTPPLLLLRCTARHSFNGTARLAYSLLFLASAPLLSSLAHHAVPCVHQLREARARN